MSVPCFFCLLFETARCVAACVMATLGWDLLKDALWDSRPRLDAFEYASVVIITIVIAAQGFVTGIAAGKYTTSPRMPSCALLKAQIVVWFHLW